MSITISSVVVYQNFAFQWKRFYSYFYIFYFDCRNARIGRFAHIKQTFSFRMLHKNLLRYLKKRLANKEINSRI